MLMFVFACHNATVSLAREQAVTARQFTAAVYRSLFLFEILLENDVREYVVNHAGCDLDQ